jgi:hypothetical protein
MQARAWLEFFPREQLRIVRMDDFTRDRAGVVAELSRFLGIEPVTESIDPDAIHNKTEDKPLLRGVWHFATRNPVYRSVRPLIPLGFRDRMRHLLLPKAPPRPNPPSISTVDFILESLGPDLEELSRLMNLGKPVWDLAKVRQKYTPNAPGGVEPVAAAV